MRRPEKTSGVIRPRTLGLGKPVIVDPPTPPPPPPPRFNFDKSKIRLAAILIVLLLFAYMSLGHNESNDLVNHPSAPSEGEASQGLRGNHLSDNEEDDEEDEEESHPKKKSKHHKVDEVEEEEEGDQDEDSEKAISEEEEVVSDTNESDESGDSERSQNQIQKSDNVASSAEHDGLDRSRSVESYFKNFGGNVVEIDREGSYKYVLIRIEDSLGGKAYVVRGCPHKEGTHCKHDDAYSRAKVDLELRGLSAIPMGGGRITRHRSRHQKGQKAGYISIFGHSKTFGSCEKCNQIACTLIKAYLPDHGVKWANEGYYESDERKMSDSAWTRC